MNTNTNRKDIVWVKKPELALHLKCSVRHIDNLMKSRLMPYSKIGRSVLFDLQACDEAAKKLGVWSILDNSTTHSQPTTAHEEHHES